MLVIRQSQMSSLADASLRRFEDEMVEHLREFAPRLSDIMKEQGVRRAVRLGFERSEGYGLTNRGPRRFYLELMFTLGSHFDTDPQLPWAQEILTDKTLTDQMLRADALYRASAEYLDDVLGAQNEYAVEALERLNATPLEEYDLAGDGAVSRALSGMRTIHPRKSDRVGEAVLRLIALRGIALADEYQIPSSYGRALMIALAFGFGHRVVEDPVYPWVAATLADASTPEPEDRCRKLHRRMRTYVERTIEHLR